MEDVRGQPTAAEEVGEWYAMRLRPKLARAARERTVATASVAALGAAKWGAGESYFLSAIAASCVLSSCWVVRALESPSLHRRAAVAAALLLQGLLLAHGTVSDVAPFLPDHIEDAGDEHAGP